MSGSKNSQSTTLDARLFFRVSILAFVFAIFGDDASASFFKNCILDRFTFSLKQRILKASSPELPDSIPAHAPIPANRVSLADFQFIRDQGISYRFRSDGNFLILPGNATPSNQLARRIRKSGFDTVLMNESLIPSGRVLVDPDRKLVGFSSPTLLNIHSFDEQAFIWSEFRSCVENYRRSPASQMDLLFDRPSPADKEMLSQHFSDGFLKLDEPFLYFQRGAIESALNGTVSDQLRKGRMISERVDTILAQQELEKSLTYKPGQGIAQIKIAEGSYTLEISLPRGLSRKQAILLSKNLLQAYHDKLKRTLTSYENVISKIENRSPEAPEKSRP
jgi:hypothetical protein